MHTTPVARCSGAGGGRQIRRQLLLFSTKNKNKKIPFSFPNYPIFSLNCKGTDPSSSAVLVLSPTIPLHPPFPEIQH